MKIESKNETKRKNNHKYCVSNCVRTYFFFYTNSHSKKYFLKEELYLLSKQEVKEKMKGEDLKPIVTKFIEEYILNQSDYEIDTNCSESIVTIKLRKINHNR